MTLNDEKPSVIDEVAFKAGYQQAKMKAAEKELEKKWKLTKWAYRIIDFIGFRRSAKLAYKGYKAKKKLEVLTGRNDKADFEKRLEETQPILQMLDGQDSEQHDERT